MNLTPNVIIMPLSWLIIVSMLEHEKIHLQLNINYYKVDTILYKSLQMVIMNRLRKACV